MATYETKPSYAQQLPLSSLPLSASFDCGKFFPEGWRNMLSPEIKASNQALQRMKFYPMGLLDPNTSPAYRLGIRVAPAYDGFELIRLGESDTLVTRGFSRNEVAFGSLELRSTDRHYGGQAFVLPVAVKRIIRREDREHPELASEPAFGLWEACRNVTAISRGFVRTTTPVAVICDQDASYIMTLTQKDIKSFDTEPWRQFNQGRDEVNEHFKGLMAKMAQTVADAHIRGIQLGDAQIKNFYQTVFGEVGFLDWEEARFLSEKPSANEIVEAAYLDLYRLYLSLSGSLTGDPDGDFIPHQILGNRMRNRLSRFRRYILNPYIEKMQKNAAETGHLSDGEIQGLFNHQKDATGNLEPNLAETVLSAI